MYAPKPDVLAVVRQDTRDALSHLGVALDSDLASAVLIAVNELATNAVEHARTSFTVAVLATARGVRAEVSDSSSAVPVLPDPGEGTVPVWSSWSG